MVHFISYLILTPQHNGRLKLKHRHIVEFRLAMLFHAHALASYWVDAFASATFIIYRLPTKILNNKSPFKILYSRMPNYMIFSYFRMPSLPTFVIIRHTN